MNFFPKKGLFDAYLDRFTADRHFLAVHLATIHEPWSKRLFSGEGNPEVEPLKLGCRQYWDMLKEKGSGGGGQ